MEASVATTRATPRSLGNVPALDGLRAIAVLVVVAHHVPVVTQRFHSHIVRAGGLGVDAFFVLSGFLITALLLREHSASGRVRVGAFYRRRALRLLPALLVFLAAHAVYAAVIHAPANHERSSLLSVLFYYSNTGLAHLSVTPGLGQMWSLAVEEQFYLVWPLALTALLLVFRPRPRAALAITIAAIVVVAVRRAVLFEHGAPALYLTIRTSTRADSLLVGAVLAMLWTRRRTPTRGLAIAATIASAFFFFLVVHGASDRFLNLGGRTLVAIAVAVVILAVLESSWAGRRLLGARPLRGVGRVSYGIYIWHLGVFVAVAHFCSSWTPIERLFFALPVTAAICTLSWFVVERPFLRWKSRLETHRDATPSREQSPTPPRPVVAAATAS